MNARTTPPDALASYANVVSIVARLKPCLGRTWASPESAARVPALVAKLQDEVTRLGDHIAELEGDD